MARDWESWLKNSTGPASNTEEDDRDRTQKRIRDAIVADNRLNGNVRVFATGSYANGTNIRRDSDVDVAVEWKSWSYVTKNNSASGLSWTQLGVSLSNPSIGPEPQEHRGWVEEALIAAFGSASVDTSGKKHIHVPGSSTTLDADIVPCFRHHRYDRAGQEPHQGVRLYPKSGGHIHNWPDQNDANATSKNKAAGGYFKQIVRALKRLENDMVENGLLDSEVHGYFITCLLYNVDDGVFKLPTWTETALGVLGSLYMEIDEGRAEDWVEVNALKWLWRSGQTWTQEEAADFALRAFRYIRG